MMTIGEFLITTQTLVPGESSGEVPSFDNDGDKGLSFLSPLERCTNYFDSLLGVFGLGSAPNPSNPTFVSQSAVECQTQQHSRRRRAFIQGAPKSGKSSLLMEWAITLACSTVKSRSCCSQCQTNPETCRCNDIDMILCRPQSNNPNPSASESAENFPSILLEQICSPRELLALHRIHIHRVRTRRQFLALLLKLQGRAVSEQPRRAILVDDLDRLVSGAENVDGIPDQTAQQHREALLLSQLGTCSMKTRIRLLQ